MVFGPEEEGAFTSARDTLVARFEAWAAAKGADVDPFVVSTALDYKWSPGDGILGRWTQTALRKLLLEWYPRSVPVDERYLPAVLPTLHAFVDFLSAAGLAGQRGDDPATLHTYLDAVTGDFAAAMADRSNWGLEKFLVTTMAERGIDTNDDDAVRDFIADAEAGMIDFDADLVDGIIARDAREAAKPKPPLFPPVALSPEDELVALAAKNEVVRWLLTFTAWVGTGKALTQTGRLKLADARELVELLGTGDTIDPVIGDRVFKTTTSEELYHLNLIVQWAKAVRVVRIVKGRLVPVKSAAKLLDRPLELWARALESLGKLGDVICVGGLGESMMRWKYENAFGTLVCTLYATALPLDIAKRLVWDVITAHDHAAADDPHAVVWRMAVDRDFDRLLEALELLGAVRHRPTSEVFTPERPAELTEPHEDDSLELTPLGTWGERRRLLAEGFRLPSIDDLAAEEAEVAIATSIEAGPDVIDAVLEAWCARRTPNAAAKEMLALIRRTDDPAHRMCALRGFEVLGGVGAEAVRTLIPLEGLSPVAKLWLIEHDQADEVSPLTETDAAYALTDRLAAMRRLAGAEGVIAVLSEMDKDSPASIVALLPKARHPDLADILDTINAEHPDKLVAKAARKALFTVRSRSAE